MSHEQSGEFLACQCGSFAAQNHAGAPHRGLEFGKGVFALPALLVQSGQLCCRGLVGVQNGSAEPLDRFGVRHGVQTVLANPHYHCPSILPPVLQSGVYLAELRSVRQALAGG